MPWLTAYPLNSFLNSRVTLKFRVSVSTEMVAALSLLLRDVGFFVPSMTQAAPSENNSRR